MLTGLTVEDYTDNILLQLGDPVVEVEIKEVLPKIIDLAFKELKQYITDTETMTVAYRNVIDLSGKNVANVHYLMRGRNTNGPGGFQDVMYIYSRQSALNTYTLTDYARALLAMQNKNALATDLDFYYDKRYEKLYVYAQQALPTTITIAYTPDYQSVEELYEPFWQNFLKQLSLAHARKILGGIRNKYTLNSATYNLDGAALLEQGEKDLTELRTYLNTNADFILPLD